MHEATRAYREAVLRGDPQAVVATFSPGAVLRSPLTNGFRFTGHSEIGPLFAAVIDKFEDIAYVGETAEGNTHMLEVKARTGGEDVHEIQMLKLD